MAPSAARGAPPPFFEHDAWAARQMLDRLAERENRPADIGRSTHYCSAEGICVIKQARDWLKQPENRPADK